MVGLFHWPGKNISVTQQFAIYYEIKVIVYFIFCSIVRCYETEVGMLNVQEEKGVPLEHLISCIKGVEIVLTADHKHLQWAGKSCGMHICYRHPYVLRFKILLLLDRPSSSAEPIIGTANILILSGVG